MAAPLQILQDEKAPPTGGTLDPAILRVIEAMARSRAPTPRLMTAEQAAQYLGDIPVAEVERAGVGRVPMGRYVRYDRAALDAHLDALAGLGVNSQPTAPDLDARDPEAALDRFLKG